MRRLFVATAIGLLWSAIFALSLFAQSDLDQSSSSTSFAIPPFEPPTGAIITVTIGLDNLRDNGDCTLREAIQAANSDAAVDACPAGNGDDLILLAAGSYGLSLEGRSEDANATGDLDILSSLVISGAGSAATVIDANQVDRVLHILTETVEIRGVTVQNGRAANGADSGCGTYGDDGCPGESGGGIVNRGSIRLIDVVIQNNRSGTGGCCVYGITSAGGGGGGGIVNSGHLELFLSLVVGNRSGDGGWADGIGGGSGGGIINEGVFIGDDITIAENEVGQGGSPPKGSSPDGSGGGIFNSGTLTITNVEITGNSGSGLHNTGNAWFFACIVSHNAGGYGSAGSAGVYNAGAIVFYRCTIDRNKAWRGAHGGGLHNAGDASLVNATVSSNIGGGAYNSIIDYPGGNGGGIYNQGNLLLQETTVTHNETRGFDCGLSTCKPVGGGSGGGLANSGGAVTIHNSIIAQNSVADGGSGPDCTGVVTSQGPNFIGDPTGCTLSGAGDDIFNQYAFLGPLSDNGGPTPTHALLPYSHALNAGSCTDISGAPILTDQRGEPRPQGAGCDLGAFESALSTIPLPETFYLPVIQLQPN